MVVCSSGHVSNSDESLPATIVSKGPINFAQLGSTRDRAFTAPMKDQSCFTVLGRAHEDKDKMVCLDADRHPCDQTQTRIIVVSGHTTDLLGESLSAHLCSRSYTNDQL